MDFSSVQPVTVVCSLKNFELKNFVSLHCFVDLFVEREKDFFYWTERMTQRGRKRKLDGSQEGNEKKRQRLTMELVSDESCDNGEEKKRAITEQEFHLNHMIYGSGSGTVVARSHEIIDGSATKEKNKTLRKECKSRIFIDLVVDEDNPREMRMKEPKKSKKKKKKERDGMEKLDMNTRRMINCVENLNHIVVTTDSRSATNNIIDAMNFIKDKYDDYKQHEMSKAVILCSSKLQADRLAPVIHRFVGVYVAKVVYDRNKPKWEQEPVEVPALKDAYVVVATPGRLAYITSVKAKLKALKQNLRCIIYWNCDVLRLGFHKRYEGYVKLKGMEAIQERLKEDEFGVIDINLRYDDDLL